jgi:predicted amidohydrolase
MNCVLIQQDIIWEHLDALFNQISQPADLIVLPEMFTTGFSMRPSQFAEELNGDAMKWMRDKAKLFNSTICGSMMMKQGDQYVNQLVWMQPDGEFFTYNKSHLFRMGEEQHHYTKGNQRMLVTSGGRTFFPMICYDLRFPVWMRRTKERNYDVIVIVANWPERRALHWRTLLQARAIENQCMVIAVNRVGNDGNGMPHIGDSMIISAKGEVMVHLKNQEAVHMHALNFEEMDAWRKDFPVIEDADIFHLG